jgi:hypothetical protein
MTDITNRLVAPCANRIIDSSRGIDEFSIDLGALVRRLILFDKYILQTIRLRELPYFIRAFGYNGTRSLLESGLVDFECDAGSIGQIGQFRGRLEASKPILPLGSYHFSYVGIADRGEFLRDCMSVMSEIPGLSIQQRNNLEDCVAGALLDRPHRAGLLALEQLNMDLARNTPVVHTAIAMGLSKRLERSIDPQDLTIQVHDLGGWDYRVESNIMEATTLDEWETHKLIELALLAVARFNERLELMQRYSALSGSRPGDLPLLTGKFEFLAEHFRPDLQETLFERVVTIGGLPDVDPDATDQYVDIPGLIAITQTPECQAFRSWLKTLQTASDQEIEDQLHPLRERLAVAVHGGSGKAVRLLTTTGIGLIPGIGTAASTILSAIDTFLLEKVISQPGPASFISTLYPSVFE